MTSARLWASRAYSARSRAEMWVMARWPFEVGLLLLRSGAGLHAGAGAGGAVAGQVQRLLDRPDVVLRPQQRQQVLVPGGLAPGAAGGAEIAAPHRRAGAVGLRFAVTRHVEG